MCASTCGRWPRAKVLLVTQSQYVSSHMSTRPRDSLICEHVYAHDRLVDCTVPGSIDALMPPLMHRVSCLKLNGRRMYGSA